MDGISNFDNLLIEKIDRHGNVTLFSGKVVPYGSDRHIKELEDLIVKLSAKKNSIRPISNNRKRTDISRAIGTLRAELKKARKIKDQESTLTEVLREGKVGKNVHLEHLEDEIFNKGLQGAEEIIDHIESIIDISSRSSNRASGITVKWDGAPAVVVGTDPESGEFFVGTKSVFNSLNPKVNFTHDDIDRNHGDKPDLAKKLHLTLDCLSGVIPGDLVLQGDFLFDSDSIRDVKIDGEDCISFRANTITYVIPRRSSLSSEVLSSKIGVIFHSIYSFGSDKFSSRRLNDMVVSFTGVDVSGFKDAAIRSGAWIDDATYKDISRLQSSDMSKFIGDLEDLSQKIDLIDASSWSFISSPKISSYLKAFINSKIRLGEEIRDIDSFIDGFKTWISLRFEGEKESLKTLSARMRRDSAASSILAEIDRHRDDIAAIMRVYLDVVRIKGDLLRVLDEPKSDIMPFMEDEEGQLRRSSPEGFVAVDHLESNAVKLVDRMGFSRSNFNIPGKFGKR